MSGLLSKSSLVSNFWTLRWMIELNVPGWRWNPDSARQNRSARPAHRLGETASPFPRYRSRRWPELGNPGEQCGSRWRHAVQSGELRCQRRRRTWCAAPDPPTATPSRPTAGPSIPTPYSSRSLHPRHLKGNKVHQWKKHHFNNVIFKNRK